MTEEERLKQLDLMALELARIWASTVDTCLQLWLKARHTGNATKIGASMAQISQVGYLMHQYFAMGLGVVITTDTEKEVAQEAVKAIAKTVNRMIDDYSKRVEAIAEPNPEAAKVVKEAKDLN